MIEYDNPDEVHAPLGPYSHTAVVPEGTELVLVSGQVGARSDGSGPETLAEQAEQAFANLAALLSAHGLTAADIVKLSTFIVAGQDGRLVGEARVKFMGAHRPTSTTVYISALVDPAWLVEVEAIAAKPARPRQERPR